jgi:1-acyl-sn-glycerol-3-phosphate acyltransferase
MPAPQPACLTAMALLRSLIHMVWMLVTVIPWRSWMVASTPFAARRAHVWRRFWLVLAIGGAARDLRRAVAHARLWSNLPLGTTSPAILLVKHQSTLRDVSDADHHAAPAGVCVQEGAAVCAVLRLGHWTLRHDPHRPQQGKQAFATRWWSRASGCWRKGIWVIMFPEGTRIPRGQAGSTRRVAPGWLWRPARR